MVKPLRSVNLIQPLTQRRRICPCVVCEATRPWKLELSRSLGRGDDADRHVKQVTWRVPFCILIQWTLLTRSWYDAVCGGAGLPAFPLSAQPTSASHSWLTSQISNVLVWHGGSKVGLSRIVDYWHYAVPYTFSYCGLVTAGSIYFWKEYGGVKT